MRVPPSVIAATGLDPLRADQSRLSNSWGSENNTLVRAGARAVVVKRWATPERKARGRAEARLLDRLAGRGFGAAPVPVRMAGGLWYETGPGGPLWTAQTFLPGRVPSAADAEEGFGVRLGRLLGALHVAGGPAPTTPVGGTRLTAGVRPLPPECVVTPEAAAVLERARAVVAPELDRMAALPLCRVHGDVRLDNLLDGPDGLTVIDLEFTGIDVRLLDLVSLVAGDRDQAGALRPLPADCVAAAVRAYADTVAGTDLALTEAETALFDTVATAFLLLVLTDQLRAGSRHARSVVPALTDLLDHPRVAHP